MTAAAIRQAAAQFESCLEGLWPHAAKRNVSRASFDQHVRGLTPDLRLMDLMDAQPEFTKALWDYLDILVNDAAFNKTIAYCENVSGSGICRPSESVRRKWT